MRRVERHVEQERILLRRHFIEKLQRKIAHGVRGVKAPSIELLRHVVFFAIETKCIVAREKIARTGKVSPVALETKIRRLLAQVPFANHRRGIARLAQHLRNRCPPTEAPAASLVAIKTCQ